jgi:hypothetical protein
MSTTPTRPNANERAKSIHRTAVTTLLAAILLVLLLLLLTACGNSNANRNGNGDGTVVSELVGDHDGDGDFDQADIDAANAAKKKDQGNKKKSSGANGDAAAVGGNVGGGGNAGNDVGSVSGSQDGSNDNGGSVNSGGSGALISFYGKVGTGQSKDNVLNAAGSLSRRCLTVSLTTAGKQEVCTFYQNGRVVTVSLNDGRVTGKSRIGF